MIILTSRWYPYSGHHRTYNRGSALNLNNNMLCTYYLLAKIMPMVKLHERFLFGFVEELHQTQSLELFLSITFSTVLNRLYDTYV